MRGLVRRAVVVVGAAVIVSGAAAGAAGASGVPRLRWSPATSGTFDYGVVAVGSSKSQAFTLKNSGGAATSALKITLTGSAAFSIADGGDGCAGIRLRPAKTCLVTVVYQPASAGQAGTATLKAASRTPAATARLTLKGTAMAAAACAAPASGQVPLNVAFTGTATGGTPPYTYSWNFGDGSATSTAQNPGHTYTVAGTYTATLTVTDSSPPAVTATSSVTITASPAASITATPQQPIAAAGAPSGGDRRRGRQ